MKFTSMQSALAVGALSAVAVPAMADTFNGNAGQELVLYVVNTQTNTAYSRGLQIFMGPNVPNGPTQATLWNGNAQYNATSNTVYGAFSASGYTSTFTGAVLGAGSTADLTAVATESVAHGFTGGYGSQNVLSMNYSLPTIAADANLTAFLSTGGTYKWSIQSTGTGTGNGASFTRRFITTSADVLDNGTNVTVGNLGMAVTDANAWAQIQSLSISDNGLNASTTNGDGTSITNSNYLSSFTSPGVNASTWYSTATQLGSVVNALSSLDSAANFYLVGSVTGSNGLKDYVITLNDVTMDAAGNLNLAVAPVPVPAAAWLLLSGLGGLGVIGRKKKA